MTYQKIINSNQYRIDTMSINAMPNGVFQKINGQDTSINLGQTSTFLTYPTNYRNIGLLNVGQVIKSSPGRMYGLAVSNTGAAIRYLKIYDKATAATSSDTPLITIAVPAGATITWPENEPLLFFSTGISVRATTGLADNDNIAPGTNDIILNFIYR